MIQKMTQFHDTRLPFIIFNTTSGKISHQARDVKYLPQRQKGKRKICFFSKSGGQKPAERNRSREIMEIMNFVVKVNKEDG